MSPFGKVLAILNAVAAIAFIVLAGMAYGKRQAWTHAVYRHDLVIDGIPLDDEDSNDLGDLRTDAFSVEMRNQVFTPVGGQPQLTQMREVDRVKGVVQGNISSSQNRWAALARYLTPFASSASKREGLAKIEKADANQLAALPLPTLEAALGADIERELKDANAETKRTAIVSRLDAMFDQLFGDLLRSRDKEDKRQAIATLLFNLSTVLARDANPASDMLESQEYRRFVTVVGLETAARTVETQAVALQGIAQVVASGTDSDRIDFVAAQRRRLLDLLTLAKELEGMQLLNGREEERASKLQGVVDVRKGEMTEMKNKIAQAKAATQKAMEEQAATEKTLFEEQRKVRDAHKKNQELEREIRGLEKGR